MKTIEQITEELKINEDVPFGYTLFETYAFLSLKRIVMMYQAGQISKEQASKLKARVENEYIQAVGQYEFDSKLYKGYIENIDKTDMLRAKLRKKMKEDTPVTEEKLYEILMICFELIELYSKEEWKYGL